MNKINLKLKKNLKIKNSLIVAVIGFIFIIASFSSCLYLFYLSSQSSVTTNELESKNTGSLTYVCKLKENDVYEGDELPSGYGYIEKYIDYFYCSLNYNYSLNRNTNITYETNYEMYINFLIGSSSSSSSSSSTLYTRNDDIWSTSEINTNTMSTNAALPIVLDYHKYNNELKEFNRITGVNSSGSISLIFKASISGTYKNKSFNSSTTLSLKVPLNSTIVSVNSSSSSVNESKVITTVTTKPIDKKPGWITLVVTAVLCVITFYLYDFFKKKENKLEFNINKVDLLKKEGILVSDTNTSIDLKNINKRKVELTSLDELKKQAEFFHLPIERYLNSKDEILTINTPEVCYYISLYTYKKNNLNKYSLDELKDIAKAYNIENYEDLSKEKLIEKILKNNR